MGAAALHRAVLYPVSGTAGLIDTIVVENMDKVRVPMAWCAALLRAARRLWPFIFGMIADMTNLKGVSPCFSAFFAGGGDSAAVPAKNARACADGRA